MPQEDCLDCGERACRLDLGIQGFDERREVGLSRASWKQGLALRIRRRKEGRAVVVASERDASRLTPSPYIASYQGPHAR